MATDFSVPYHEEIPHFKLPSKIQLSGTVKPNAKRFEIDLLSDDGEFYLHFNPRFNEDCVVRSSTKDGQNWQAEERDGGMPFALGKPFTIDFAVEEALILCSVNGSPFCEFQARDDLSQISALHIDGDIQLRSVSVLSVGVASAVSGQGKPVAPRDTGEGEDEAVLLEPEQPKPAPQPIVQPAPPRQPTPPRPQQQQPVPVPQQPAKQPTPPRPAAPAPQQPATNPPPQGKLPIPYQAPLQELVKTSRMRVVAIPYPNAQRFTVNWKTDDGETLFHFNARFDQNCVVRNATVNKQYPPGDEEREGARCPFQAGKLFALDFLVNANIVRCFVDGQEFCRFQLRGDLRQVALLDIHGDVVLQEVLIV